MLFRLISAQFSSKLKRKNVDKAQIEAERQMTLASYLSEKFDFPTSRKRKAKKNRDFEPRKSARLARATPKMTNTSSESEVLHHLHSILLCILLLREFHVFSRAVHFAVFVLKYIII